MNRPPRRPRPVRGLEAARRRSVRGRAPRGRRRGRRAWAEDRPRRCHLDAPRLLGLASAAVPWAQEGQPPRPHGPTHTALAAYLPEKGLRVWGEATFLASLLSSSKQPSSMTPSEKESQDLTSQASAQGEGLPARGERGRGTRPTAGGPWPQCLARVPSGSLARPCPQEAGQGSIGHISLRTGPHPSSGQRQE